MQFFFYWQNRKQQITNAPVDAGISSKNPRKEKARFSKKNT